MFLSKTPLRLSFFGGGTDLPVYAKNGGICIGMAINYYTFAQIYSPRLKADNSSVISYSRKLTINSHNQITNPLIRHAYAKHGLEKVNLNSEADVPSGTGLGSSSSFSNSLMACIGGFTGRYTTSGDGSVSLDCKLDIIREAITLELEDCGSPIGVQDHYLSALGGGKILYISENHTDFKDLSPELCKTICDHMLLVRVGSPRSASVILGKAQKKGMLQGLDKIKEIATMFAADPSYDEKFHDLMRKSWDAKSETSTDISNPEIEETIKTGQKLGAQSWKLFGAGGSGFIGMFFNEFKYFANASKTMSKNFDVHGVLPDFNGIKLYEI